MRLVVPTVDAIVYLTSAKCESDARTLRYIDGVTAEDKPLVIVQNKIDTIEEKLTRDLAVFARKAEGMFKEKVIPAHWDSPLLGCLGRRVPEGVRGWRATGRQRRGGHVSNGRP